MWIWFAEVAAIVATALSLSIDAFAVSITDGLCYRDLTKRKGVTIPLTFGIFQAAMPLIGFFLGYLILDYIDPYDHYIAFGLLLIIGGKMIFDGIKELRGGESEEDGSSAEDKVYDDATADENSSISETGVNFETDEIYAQGEVNTASEKEASYHASTAKSRKRAGGKKFSYPEVLLQGIATSIDALAVGFTLNTNKFVKEFSFLHVFWIVAVIGIITFCLSIVGLLIGKKIGKVIKSKASVAEIVGGVVLIAIGVKIMVEGIIGA